MSVTFSQNPFVRRGVAALARAPRAVRRQLSTEKHFAASPPLIANSLPKSGTHLLLQVLAALPGVRGYGAFIASVPSVRFRLRSERQTRRQIELLAPGEAAGAHLYYSAGYEQALADKHAVHFFLYRDPRAVAVSEMHYLTRRAWWHGLHRRFVSLPNDEQRLLLAIRGLDDELPDEYPNLRRRFELYSAWIGRPGVFSVRFEDLRGDASSSAVRRVVEHYASRIAAPIDIDRATQTAIEAVEPNRSHTFRQGSVDAWRDEFTPRVAEAYHEVVGSLAEELGYPPLDG